ncbi:MAG: methyltransferase domain-containing protein [Elusimicrobiota bacterium]
MNKYFESRYQYDKSRKSIWKAICEYLQREIPNTSTIVELGAGYCDFINQIVANKKYALDSNPKVKNFCSNEVLFLNSEVTNIDIPNNTVDVVFASNLLEHLNDEEIDLLFIQLDRVLKKGGKLILLQPNYYYCYREYWDDYTHKKAFSHISLSDLLISRKYVIKLVKKHFIPFSFKSSIPKSYFLTKIYLFLPWKPMAKQMLIIAQKE